MLEREGLLRDRASGSRPGLDAILLEAVGMLRDRAPGLRPGLDATVFEAVGMLRDPAPGLRPGLDATVLEAAGMLRDRAPGSRPGLNAILLEAVDLLRDRAPGLRPGLDATAGNAGEGGSVVELGRSNDFVGRKLATFRDSPTGLHREYLVDVDAAYVLVQDDAGRHVFMPWSSGPRVRSGPSIDFGDLPSAIRP